jgi:hypothetical protein
MNTPTDKKPSTNLEDQNINEIARFIHAWELFEKNVCQESFSVRKTASKLKEKSFKNAHFQAYLDFFKAHFLTNGSGNDLFNQLRFKTNDRRIFVTNVLTGTLTDTYDIILAMALICYRLRIDPFIIAEDNDKLAQQKQSFENATKFLQKLLEYYK